MNEYQLEAYRMMALGGLAGVVLALVIGVALFAWAWWRQQR